MEDKNYYEKAGISNSSLSYLCKDQGGSRLKYKRNYIDNIREELNTPSLANGKIIHSYIESPKDFIIADIDKPSGMMGDLVEAVFHNHGFGDLSDTIIEQKNSLGLYKSIKKDDTLVAKFEDEGKKYYDHLVLTKDKEPEFVLTSKQKDLLENCINSLRDNPNAVKELFDIPEGVERHKEFELFWTSPQTGLDCKGMIDVLDVDHTNKKVVLKDFKTTGKSISAYPEAFEYWHTYRQLSFYMHGLRYVMPEVKDYNFDIKVIAIETSGLYECRVFDISYNWVMEGIEEYESLLKEIKEGIDCNWSDEFLYKNEVI